MKTLNAPEHTDYRETGLGGSDLAAFTGDNPYSSAFDLWLDKTRRLPSEFVENKYTYWGKAKEPLIAAAYAAEHECVLIECNRRKHPRYAHIYFTPDRLIEAESPAADAVYDPVSKRLLRPRGLEIKTALYKHGPEWATPDRVIVETRAQADGRVPLYYWVQCQLYMDALEFPEWDLVVLIDSSDLRQYRLLYDSEWCGQWIPAADKWYADHVKGDKIPPVDGGKQVNRYLSMIYHDVVDGSSETVAEPIIEEAIKAREIHKVEADNLKALYASIGELEQQISGAKNAEHLTAYAMRRAEAAVRERIGTKLAITSSDGRHTAKWIQTKKGRRLLISTTSERE